MSKNDDKQSEKKKVKIRPVEFSLFCDHASVTVDGKLNLNGIFERIMTQEVPATHPQMVAMSKLVLPKGEHSISFSLMQKDKVLAKTQIEKNIEQPLAVHTHMWSIRGLQIETWEPLEMQIFIGGKQVFHRMLPVVKVEKKD